MDKIIRSMQRVCRAGLDSVSLRRELAQRIAPALPFDAYAFSTCDPDTGLMTHTLGEGVPRPLTKAFMEHLYPRGCALLGMDMPRRGTQVFSVLAESEEARDAFRGWELDDQIQASLTADGRLWGMWCLMRSRRFGSTDQSRALLERVAPDIARGLAAAALVDLARAPQVDAGDAAPGIVVLDVRGRPTMRTPLAVRWLSDLADTGMDTPEGLPLTVLALASRVRRARADVPEEALARVRGASGRWYLLRGSLTEPDASGETSIVVIVRPAIRAEVAPMLTRLYALSAREREIVAAVARGEPTKRIAAMLRISPHTVEEHLTRACYKIGVRGRKALVAKLFVEGYAPNL
jgi:DNA-binding CsgD family transcriptional regulator